MEKKRLFIVANRLPVQVQTEGEKVKLSPSAGGLVTAINSFLQADNSSEGSFSQTFWVGMPCCSAETWTSASTSLPEASYEYLPVFFPEKKYDGYYNGFANSVLWPLFHYFPSYAEYNAEHYNDYLQANTAIAEVIFRYARPNDVIWIHDYHLLPLAGLVRAAIPGITIGFFLHIPFPSYELVRLLPRKYQEELLQGMLGADLIGFHTVDYLTHFLQSVKTILGLENDNRIMTWENRLVKADVFPISIDFDRFNQAFEAGRSRVLKRALQRHFQGKKIIFSVDRLDYTKGVSNRLMGYELFLKQHPEFHEKVVFILVLVPSRDSIGRYAERKKIIDEMISNINSRIGTLNWQPVIYQYNSLSFAEMTALYTSCNMALITPLRDGMNLVSKEFAASRKDLRGVLLLSEMAGAARELVTALMLNPNDIEEIADKIHEGLTMGPDEQRQRMEAMRNRIEQYDVKAWARDFFAQLSAIKRKQEEFQVLFMDDLSRRSLFDQYRLARRRLILLDYDGTLVPFAATPEQARPGKHLKELLSQLAANEWNTVFITSGRDSATLEKWLGDLQVNIIAEHGAKIKWQSKGWKVLVSGEQEWKQQVQEMMEACKQHCPESFVETKDFSVVWHYRNADPLIARRQSLELFKDLNEFTYNMDVQVLMGNKLVEVRVKGVDKGSILKKEVLKEDYDFVLAIGDDRTDEDMFRALMGMEQAFTIKIGAEASFARFNLHTPHMVTSLLESMTKVRYHHLYG